MRGIHEHSWAGIHSCFYSVGDRMVVILPSFTIALFKGNPFLYPTHQPPPLPSFPLHIQRELSSAAAKQGKEILSTVKAERYKNQIWGNDWECYAKKIHFCLEVNTNTLIALLKCDESLSWTEL